MSALLEVSKDIIQQAAQRKNPSAHYAGDVTPAEAWAILSATKAVLIDVRTEPEWRFSGVPKLDATPSSLHFVSWVSYPDFEMNGQFESTVQRDVVYKNTPVLLLCKLGGRSHHAGNLLAGGGYSNVYNILHGFEGEHNEQMQRGQVNGWKAEGLPWTQS